MTELAWIRAQRKTFLRWCNFHLNRHNQPLISSIEKDLCQGSQLLTLIGCVSGKPISVPENADNVTLISQALKVLETEGNIRVVNFNASDIASASSTAILNLLWTLIVRFEVIHGANKACPKKALLNWCNDAFKPQGVSVADFSSSWKDGSAFCALANVASESQCIDLTTLNKQSVASCANNIELALDKLFQAKKLLAFLDAPEIASEPDELSVMTYVATARGLMLSNEVKRKESEGALTISFKDELECYQVVVIPGSFKADNVAVSISRLEIAGAGQTTEVLSIFLIGDNDGRPMQQAIVVPALAPAPNDQTTAADVAPSSDATDSKKEEKKTNPFPLVDLDDAQISKIVDSVKALQSPGENAKVADLYPLSPLQRSLFDQTNRYKRAGLADPFINHLVVVPSKPLDSEIAAKAWDELAKEDPILRSCVIGENDAVPTQVVVQSDAPAPIKTLDWSDCNGDQQKEDEKLAGFLHDDLKEGFDLAKAPLVRVTLAKLGDGKEFVVLTSHQILMDSKSVAVLSDRFMDVYDALSNPDAAPAESDNKLMPYRDYLEWKKNEHPESDDDKFWKDELADLKPCFLSSVLYTAPAEQAPDVNHDAAGEKSIVFSPEASEKLKDLAKQGNAPLAAVLHAKVAVVLSEYFQRGDVIVGAALEGRPNLPKKVLGTFENVLPLHTHVDGKQTMKDLIEKTQRKMKELDAHGQAELDRLFEEYNIGETIFDVLCRFEDKSSNPRDSSLALSANYASARETALYDLVLSDISAPDGAIGVRASFHPTRIPSWAVQDILEKLAGLAEAVTKAADVTIEDAKDSFKPAADSSNNKENESPANAKSVADAVAALGSKPTNDAALAIGDQKASFGDVHSKSNKLSHHVKAVIDHKPDTVVAVCVRRGPGLVVAAASLAKLGVVCLALDVETPHDRVEEILKQMKPQVVVCQPETRSKFEHAKVPIIDMNDSGDVTSNPSFKIPKKAKITSVATPDSTLYITFPSRKKYKVGVQASVKHVNAFVAHFSDAYELQESDKVDLTGCTHVEQLFPLVYISLIRGIPIVCSDSSQDYPTHLENSGATIAVIYKREVMLLNAAPASSNKLRHAIVLGGLKKSHHSKSLIEKYPNATISVVYTLPETVGSGVGVRISATDIPELKDILPLGRPLPGASCYVINESSAPVPVGVPGELTIGGDFLSDGYVNDPERTADRFPSIQVGADTIRVFRTRKVVRKLPDGTLEYVGEKEDFVDIDGVSVMLSAVDDAIHEIKDSVPNIEDAAVIVGEDKAGKKRLVGYVVLDANAPIAPRHRLARVEVLSAKLADNVPSYMVPTQYVVVDKIPRDEEGNVIRDALPAVVEKLDIDDDKDKKTELGPDAKESEREPSLYESDSDSSDKADSDPSNTIKTDDKRKDKKAKKGDEKNPEETLSDAARDLLDENDSLKNPKSGEPMKKKRSKKLEIIENGDSTKQDPEAAPVAVIEDTFNSDSVPVAVVADASNPDEVEHYEPVKAKPDLAFSMEQSARPVPQEQPTAADPSKCEIKLAENPSDSPKVSVIDSEGKPVVGAAPDIIAVVEWRKSAECGVQDNGDGTYAFDFPPAALGPCVVNATIGGKPLPGTPLSMEGKPKDLPEPVKATVKEALPQTGNLLLELLKSASPKDASAIAGELGALMASLAATKAENERLKAQMASN